MLLLRAIAITALLMLSVVMPVRADITLLESKCDTATDADDRVRMSLVCAQAAEQCGDFAYQNRGEKRDYWLDAEATYLMAAGYGNTKRDRSKAYNQFDAAQDIFSELQVRRPTIRRKTYIAAIKKEMLKLAGVTK